MPQRVAAKRSVSKAYRVIKEISSQGVPWSEDYRFYSRIALKQFLEGRMKANLDSYLEEMAVRGEEDRRNGRYSRHLLTEIGDVQLEVPRTRRYSALKVVRAYCRRAQRIDRMILSCFVLGISTRKVAEALFPVLGERVSASTVSRVGKQLDQVVDPDEAFRDIDPLTLPGSVEEISKDVLTDMKQRLSKEQQWRIEAEARAKTVVKDAKEYERLKAEKKERQAKAKSKKRAKQSASVGKKRKKRNELPCGKLHRVSGNQNPKHLPWRVDGMKS